MIFHENCLHSPDLKFLKKQQILNCRLLQIIGGALWVMSFLPASFPGIMEPSAKRSISFLSTFVGFGVTDF